MMSAAVASQTKRGGIGRSITFADAQARGDQHPGLIAEMRAVIGDENVRVDFPTRLCYARDRLPWGTFNIRRGKLPFDLPAAIVAPANHDEVRALLRLANAAQVPVIPFGAGSGVLGATLPLRGEIMLDLKRLNRILAWHDMDGMVDVQAGMNGGEFERALNQRGFMCGHYPQSLRMSTVGGWVACRGAGQESTRYGKIEHLVRGMNVVMANGDDFEVRAGPPRAVGPSLQDLLVGSEGTLGVITSLSLRMFPLPALKQPLVLAYGNLAEALQASRNMLQAELRPAVFRLHDETESRTKVRGLSGFDAHPILCFLEFHGDPRLVEVEYGLARDIALRHGAMVGSNGPFEDWLAHRFQSYSVQAQAENNYQDTIEVSAPWSRLEAMHAAMREAVTALHPALFFGTHWSHAYAEGACQYMTFRLPAMADDEALAIHARLWETVHALCSEHGGSISHHHGIGFFRADWMAQDIGRGGLDVLRQIKVALDPRAILNPGKLGL